MNEASHVRPLHRQFGAILIGCALGLGAGLAALPALDDSCVSPETRLLDIVCPPSAVAIRTSLLRRASSRAPQAAPATVPQPEGPPVTRSAAVEQQLAEVRRLQQRVSSLPSDDPRRAGEAQELRRRMGELRSLPYGGQEAADEALGALSMLAPDLAADPVFRAGARIGGVGIDAGTAVNHVIGPNIDRVAERVDGMLSRLRPPQ